VLLILLQFTNGPWKEATCFWI